MRKSATGFSRLACLALIILVFSAALNAQDNPPRSVPRIELGAVLSAARQTFGNYYHAGGGGRITINVMRYLVAEGESTRQPTGSEPYIPAEFHPALAAKATYRAEARRWLRFAGVNFFGVIGPAWVNRSVYVAGIPGDMPPPRL